MLLSCSPDGVDGAGEGSPSAIVLCGSGVSTVNKTTGRCDVGISASSVFNRLRLCDDFEVGVMVDFMVGSTKNE